jgi:hypothetical protein
MSPKDKVLVWFVGEVKTPPFSSSARIEAGYLLRLRSKKVNRYLCPNPVRCLALVKDAMNCELMMRIKLGELSIVSY